MENEKLGQESAFPNDGNWANGNPEPGISKRFYAACCVLQGFAAHRDIGNFKNQYVCTRAFELADELLKQENE